MRKAIIGIGAAVLAATTVAGGIALADGHPSATASAALHDDGGRWHHAHDVRATGTPGIDADQARKAVLAARPGSRVTSTELEGEHGVLVWKVTFVTGGARRVMTVDTRTGKIILADGHGRHHRRHHD